jgi:hypothetical protein
LKRGFASLHSLQSQYLTPFLKEKVLTGLRDAWHRRCLASEILGIGEATASLITLGGIAKICLLKKIQIKIAPHNAKFSGILHFVQNDRWEGRMTKGGVSTLWE